MTDKEAEVKQEETAEAAEAEKQPAEAVAEEPKAEKKEAGEAKKEKPAKASAKGTQADVASIIETLKTMTVLDLSQLVKALEDEFGVSAAAPMMAAPMMAAAEAPAAEEEKTEFNVILKDAGSNRIAVIKAVRELSSLGLKESKDLVESVPQPVKEGVSKEEATAAKEKLEAAGATADIT